MTVRFKNLFYQHILIANSCVYLRGIELGFLVEINISLLKSQFDLALFFIIRRVMIIFQNKNDLDWKGAKDGFFTGV